MGAVESLTTFGLVADGGLDAPGSTVDLRSILSEIQGIRIGRITGANATRAILAGIASGDAPLAVALFGQTGVGLLRVVGPASLAVPTQGFLTIASSNNTSRMGLVFWWDKSGKTSWALG